MTDERLNSGQDKKICGDQSYQKTEGCPVCYGMDSSQP